MKLINNQAYSPSLKIIALIYCDFQGCESLKEKSTKK